MRTLVKIGLVIPMVALLVFTVALAEETKESSDLNGTLNDDKARTTSADDDSAEVAPVVRESFGERRNIASRRGASNGRGALNAANDGDRWWDRGSGSSGSSSSSASGSGKSASDSSVEESPDDFGSDSSSGKSGSS